MFLITSLHFYVRQRQLFVWASLLIIALLSWKLSPSPSINLPLVSSQGQDFFPSYISSLDHSRRDSYTCSASSPCSNGACCGASGYCGYGSVYCGTGCLSNCNATAECGIDASVVNTTCPLNTCCSQYGFCGTTEDFCTNGCQSNCVLNPAVPSTGTSNTTILSKVIGYYEAWNAESTCHQTLPTDLPLAALTHINVAFAYLDPDTYDITTMDSDMPTSIFNQVTDLKSDSSSLKVFVSVGGWAFSDNDTDTQPLFGEIAASATNRKTFANNALSFLTTYGFDGLDIDWEYPGAPDRGGSPDDTANYVKLMAELRSVFDASGRDLGLTFTLPSSYWYMRWFDVPGLLEYADWINFMTYDLHGTWDATDPIGAIVQSHTNLTDIKTAIELLWRVGIDPSDVVMGFGFYGRSFTLDDDSCTTPGCPFSAGGNPGSCTDTSGYLAYYEILEVLEANPSVVPVYDESAAVMYFSWDDNQWISYDDETTFKQKVDWANSIGLGGAMIWASDQDTYSWTAHEALLDKTLMSNSQAELESDSFVNNELVVTAMTKSLSQDCYRGTGCVDLNNPQVTCDKGYSLVGYDKQDCRNDAENWGMPICCDTVSKPSSCQWRGGGLDCDGQCHVGELTLFTSPVGGGSYKGFKSQSGTSKCNRGDKAFCCTDDNFDNLIGNCDWTGCNGACKSGKTSVANAYDLNGECTVEDHAMHYCCASNPAPLKDCHWVGSGDCADNRCANTEVTVKLDSRGDSFVACNWGRKKALCCTPDTSISVPAVCDAVDLCNIDSYYCGDDISSLKKRESVDENIPLHEDKEFLAILGLLNGTTYTKNDIDNVLTYHTLQARGAARVFNVQAYVKAVNYIVSTKSLAYPSIGDLYTGSKASQVLQKTYSFASQSCGQALVSAFSVPSSKTGLEADHVIDLQYVRELLVTATTGVLPSGDTMKSSIIDIVKVKDYWRTSIQGLSKVPSITNGNSLVPNDRFFNAIGSTGNRYGLIGLAKEINNVKGRIFDFTRTQLTKTIDGNFDGGITAPFSETSFTKLLTKSIKSGTGEEQFLALIRDPMSVFAYLTLSDVEARINMVRSLLYTEAKYISEYVPGFSSLPDIMNEFDPVFYSVAQTQVVNWVTERLLEVAAAYTNAPGTPGNSAIVKTTWDLLYEQLSNVKAPTLTSQS